MVGRLLALKNWKNWNHSFPLHKCTSIQALNLNSYFTKSSVNQTENTEVKLKHDPREERKRKNWNIRSVFLLIRRFTCKWWNEKCVLVSVILDLEWNDRSICTVCTMLKHCASLPHNFRFLHQESFLLLALVKSEWQDKIQTSVKTSFICARFSMQIRTLLLYLCWKGAFR